MTVAMKHINQLIDEQAIIDNNIITYPNTDISIVKKMNIPVWKQIKNNYPEVYKEICDQIFDELHPF
jgi:hypothetical protein